MPVAPKARVLEHLRSKCLAQVTPALEPLTEGKGGCPCGRYHPPARVRRALRRTPQDPLDLGRKILAASFAGKAERKGGGFFEIAYHGDCSAPIGVHADDGRQRHATYKVRCRRCGACRRAKRNYWGFAAMQVTLDTMESGGRTWFGTLTLSPEAQALLLQRARRAHAEPDAEWWQEPHCDERFAAVRVQFLKEVQKYWKRLRKRGFRFRYLLVFERHRSGLPHAHFLLHEENGPIRKREARSQWPWGFFQASLVGGRARNAAAPDKAAWYAVKYLTKSDQSRVVASRGYAPMKRPKGQRSGRTVKPMGGGQPPRARASEERSDEQTRTRDDHRRATHEGEEQGTNEGVSVSVHT